MQSTGLKYEFKPASFNLKKAENHKDNTKRPIIYNNNKCLHIVKKKYSEADSLPRSCQKQLLGRVIFPRRTTNYDINKANVYLQLLFETLFDQTARNSHHNFLKIYRPSVTVANWHYFQCDLK